MKRKKSTFFTDYNLSVLPIFSCSTKLVAKENEEIIYLKDKKLKLIIRYYNKQILSAFDNKIFKTIEYLLCNSINFKELKQDYENKYIFIKNKYKKEYNLTKLTEFQEQQILFATMKELKEKYRLYTDLKEINDEMQIEYNHGAIKNAIKKIGNTYIELESDFFYKKENQIKEKNIYSKIPLIEFSINEKPNKLKEKLYILINLNPYHFYHLMNDQNLNKLNYKKLISFKNPIAMRLYELIRLKKYGCIEHKKDYFSMRYDDLTTYLRIKKRDRIGLIKQQLKGSFDELIEKQEFYWYEIEKGSYDFVIKFYINYHCFETYYKKLNSKTKKRLQLQILKLKKDEEKYNAFENEMLKSFNKIKYVWEEKKEQIKHYYQFYYLNEKYNN